MNKKQKEQSMKVNFGKAILVSLGLYVGSLACAQAPFSTKANLFDPSKTDNLGLTKPTGIQTATVYTPSSTSDHYSNAVAVVGFKGVLYCQWQSSKTDEDSEDTWVAYSRSFDGLTWSSPLILAASPSDGYRSSGGWWVNGDTLVGYINHWPSALTPRGGYTEYRTSLDGLNWSSIQRVKMANGSNLDAIFEQDPHVLPSGRIINAAHFQPGLKVSPIYTDDPSGVRNWVKPSFTNMAYTGDVTMEIEPSSYLKRNNTIVMIFRDQNGSYLKLASQSTDLGLTWSSPVLTDMPDSRSKQSAGNLPDGTAFFVSNPVTNKNRIPLVVTLSKDGNVFDKAYLLRDGASDLQAQKYTGLYKTIGYSYPKSTVYNGYLYVAFSVNKEDVQCTRIPLSSLGQNNACANGVFDACNICSGGTTGLLPCTAKLEAESACVNDGTVDANNIGFSAKGFVNTANDIGSEVSWVLNSPSAQKTTISFRYANGGATNRDGEIIVNGASVGILSLPPTGSWTTWSTVSVNLNLKSQYNVLRLISNNAGGLANLDVIYVSSGVSNGNCVVTGLNSTYQTHLTVYPNPTQNSVNWNSNQEWVLMNLQGKTLQTGRGESMDLSGFSSGVYLFKIDGTVIRLVKN